MAETGTPTAQVSKNATIKINPDAEGSPFMMGGGQFALTVGVVTDRKEKDGKWSCTLVYMGGDQYVRHDVVETFKEGERVAFLGKIKQFKGEFYVSDLVPVL